MTGTQRRQRLLEILRQAEEPVTGSDLARRLGVTRQVIVQDIALLRAQGAEVLSTPRGYLLASGRTGPGRAVLACRHTREQVEEELRALVEAGLKVVDVVVEHPLYGELRGLLMLATLEDVGWFLGRLRATGSALLAELTGGVHLHTVEFTDPLALERARSALRRLGFLLEEGREEGEPQEGQPRPVS